MFVVVVVGQLACAKRHDLLVRADSSMYGRVDDDRTTVLSPRVAGNVNVDERWGVEAAYTMDAWSGASVDVMTAATSTIRERRHEGSAVISYAGRDSRGSVGVRHSREPDYVASGWSGGFEVDLFRRNTTLAVRHAGGYDIVGRAGQPTFRQPLITLTGRASLTQILSKTTIAALGWETTSVLGYQASPYRFVGVGGDGDCGGTAPWCLPERVPSSRTRHALLSSLRQGITRRASVGGDHRFYFDSWGVRAHTLTVDLRFAPAKSSLLGVEWRLHTQREADFYRPRYFDFDETSWVTRDRKLSTYFSHGVTLFATQDFPLRGGEVVLAVGARATGSLLRYLNFVGLERVLAMEATLFMGVRFGATTGPRATRGRSRRAG